MSPTDKSPQFAAARPDLALQHIAENLPRLLANVSIERAHIVADQWMAALKSGNGDSIVPVMISENPSDANRAAVAAAVVLHPAGADAATMLFAFVSHEEPADHRVRIARHLATEIEKQLAPRGVAFLQWASDPIPSGGFAMEFADLLGFTALGHLQYMNLNEINAATGTHTHGDGGETDRLEAVPIGDFGDLDGFAWLVEQTYQGSLDCPDFNVFRSAGDLLGSYRLSPTFCPEGWHWVQGLGESVRLGVLIMSLHDKGREPPVAELTYMGITPEHRGNGFGRDLLNLAIDWANDAGCQRVVLAVDVENTPAIDVYQNRGFRPILQESVWGRRIQNP